MNIERSPLQIAVKARKGNLPGVKGSAYKTLMKHNARVVLFTPKPSYGHVQLNLTNGGAATDVFSVLLVLGRPPRFLTSEL